MTSNVRVSAGGVVVGPAGQVVVVSQNGDSWSLPKGGVEDGETLRTAAEREIAEESGIKDLGYVCELGEYERYQIAQGGVRSSTSVRKKIVTYLYTTTQHELSPVDPDNPEARWVDVEAVSELLTAKEDKAFFDSIKPEVYKLLQQKA